MPGGEVALPLGSRAAVAIAYAGLAALAWLAHRAFARTDTRRAQHRRALAALERAPARASVVIAAAVVAALALARLTTAPRAAGQLTVTFLDVGQGDATLIQHPDGTAVLFDGGPPEGRVARLLRRAGVRRLSALVMTHASRDHHGGLPEVVQRFPIELLLYNPDGTRRPRLPGGDRRRRRRAGARLVEAIAPDEATGGSAHDPRALAAARAHPGRRRRTPTRARWWRS